MTDKPPVETVLVPFGELGSKDRIESSTEEYKSNYEIREAVDPENKRTDQMFIDAFQSEFGFSFENFREFADVIEDERATTGLAVFEVQRSDLVRALSAETEARTIVELAACDQIPVSSFAGSRQLPHPHPQYAYLNDGFAIHFSLLICVPVSRCLSHLLGSFLKSFLLSRRVNCHL